MRSGADLAAVLDSVASVVAETLAFELVVVSLHRPAWDDFEVAAVRGSDEARAAISGQRLAREYWQPLLDPRFEREGAHFVPHDQRDWSTDAGSWFIPDRPAPASAAAWHPADALVVPLRRSGGELLGILSVNEPRSGLRPSDDELAVLSAFAAQVAQLLESAQEDEAMRRHGATLEHLFLVSSELLRTTSVDRVLRLVCDGVHAVLGFGVAVVELADVERDRYRPAAAAGTNFTNDELELPVSIGELDRIFRPEFEVEGCYLLSRYEALELVPGAGELGFESTRNGTGARAWNRHWLIVPLYDREGERIGFIWADDPADRLIPTREQLQTLRLFANQAVTALESAATVEALHSMSELQRAIIESSPSAVITTDTEGCVQLWNPAAERMYGWTAAETVGRRPPQVVGEEAEFAAILGRVVTGEAISVEVERRRKDGSTLTAAMSAAPLKDAAGQVVGVVSLQADVTDRRRAERELARQNAELEALHDTTLHLLDRLDSDDVVQAILERAGELVGTEHGYVYLVDREREELEMFVASGKFEEDLGFRLARGEGLSGRVWETGRAQSVDDYTSWPGRVEAFQKSRFGANIAVPLHAGDEVVGVLGLAHPVGGRTFDPAEQALLERFGRLASLALQNARLYDEVHKSRELYRKVVETSTDVISLMAPDGTILFNSPAIGKVLGYGEPELHGENFALLVHREDLEPASQVFADTLAGRDVSGSHVLRARHKDGHWIDLEYEPVAIRREDGEVEMVLTIARDVTERTRQEQELRESRELFRTVVENANDLIALIGLDGKLLYVSPSHLDVLGYSPGDFVGEHVSTRVHPDDVDASSRPLDEVIEQGESTYSIRVAHRDGHWVMLEGVNKLLRDERGRPRMIHSTARDVTHERALEEQLRAAQKMEAIGRLAGGVAHDFNNLLTAIDGYGEFALEQLPEASAVRRHVVEMKRAGERAATLTRQLLAFSRRQVLQPKVVDLNEVIDGMEGLIARLIGEDVRVATSLAADLGRTRADPSQIEQVVMNLVVNARDAMPRGGTIRIETANADLDEAFAEQHVGARPGPHVALIITDTGTGMDRATLERVFEPFFTTKAAGQGTGLGLSTVYGIVKQTGGSIWAYSEPGRGTTFKVYLPRAWERASLEEARAPRRTVAGSGTVLVVEDEPIVRELVREMLTTSGYAVLAAPNGRAAVEVAGAHDGPIDVLMTDVVMPGMSGQQVAELVATERPDMRVLFTSGYTEDAISNHGVLRPGASFLEKPFTAAQLGQKLHELLRTPLAA